MPDPAIPTSGHTPDVLPPKDRASMLIGAPVLRIPAALTALRTPLQVATDALREIARESDDRSAVEAAEATLRLIEPSWCRKARRIASEALASMGDPGR